MKKTVLLPILAAALCAASSASAATYDYLIKGTSCVSTTPGNNGTHGQWGIFNDNTAAAMTVTCPLPLPNKNYLSATLQVRGYNRNAADPLSCTLLSTDLNGDLPATGTANVPFHATLPMTGNAGLNPVPLTNWISLSCRIPARTAANGRSYLTSIYVAANY